MLYVVPCSARADVGLVIETPTGLLGFLSNVGHVSVWISHGCLDAAGHVRYCENTAGLVLTSTAYWPNPGAAAIPAELFFLGTRPGVAGRGAAAWTSSLGEIYPDVQPAVGAKYLGRTWLRSLRVVKFATSTEDDRRVLAEIDAVQHDYRYSYSKRNCAFYAQAILQQYLGASFHGNRLLELGIDTPRAVERALQHNLKDQSRSYEVVHFKGDLHHAWRQPSRNICESAILDPKYAIPLLLYQPYLYAGFAGCYAAIRVSTWASPHHPPLREANPVLFVDVQDKEPRLRAFQALTGVAAMGPDGRYDADAQRMPLAVPVTEAVPHAQSEVSLYP
ncbi:hypothetical protein [Acidipila sp. EB88]|uniref:hypothetical protein n=1 Tax=Acidipila sp. EB88 TaxID=2305226 RepID=UPI000F601575|nr:hypothetical protein [Acidipila sp. EB88]RRA49539.1 hypothetical protein D1Y84_15925 [Acidipila sp. EB88]